MSFISQNNKQAMRNPWVLGWLLGLAIVLVVNVVFITTAFTTSPGLVEENYYEKGRDHEQNVQKKLEARTSLGWDLQYQLPAELRVGESQALQFSLRDRAGQPFLADKLQLQIYRPSDVSADFTVTPEAVATGLYSADVVFQLPGIWDLNISALSEGEQLQWSQRIYVNK